MSTTNLKRSAAFVAAGMIAVVFAASARSDEEKPKEKAPPTLEQVMEKLGKAYGGLRRQVGKAEKTESSLELLATIEHAAATGMMMPTTRGKALPEEEQPAFHLAYKRQMLKMLSAAYDVEEQLIKGDHAKAKELFKKLGGIRKVGHEQFQVEEEE